MRISSIIGLSCVPLALSITASPRPFNETQPDGTSVKLLIKGDEDFNYLCDEHEFTVERDDQGWYTFADLNGRGRLAPGQWKVGLDNPVARNIVKKVLPSKQVQKELLEERCNGCKQETQAKLKHNFRAWKDKKTKKNKSNRRLFGQAVTMPNLVLPMLWSDHTQRTVPSKADIEVLFNNAGPATLAPSGSIKDLYKVISYDSLELDSTVVDWVTIDNTEAHYSGGDRGLNGVIRGAIIYALDQLDAANFDFAQFDDDNDGWIDGLTLLHSGYGAEFGGTDCNNADYKDRIWSHKSGLGTYPSTWTSHDGVKVSAYHISPGLWGTCNSNIGRIGVIAHETGHFLGLPDLYDYGSGSGIGSYGLMGNSWGFDGSQYRPPIMSAWSKQTLGFTTPTVISQDGTYSIQDAYNNDQAYRIDQGFPTNEYLLIENRQPKGFESNMPQGGLAIWHIDETSSHGTGGFPGQSGWPANTKHYRVALLQADGMYNLENGRNSGDSGDLWHAGPFRVSNGCYQLDSAACCRFRDGRAGWYDEPCVLAAGANFISGNVCEPKNWAEANDASNIATCGTTSALELGPSADVNTGPFPNTDSYQASPLVRSGARIYDISTSADTMTFKVQFTTAQPTPNPTPAPTPNPTPVPSVAPLSCAGLVAWDSVTVYPDTSSCVIHLNFKYCANHWTKNNSPDTENGEGLPWTLQGACSGTTPAPTTPAPTPNPTTPNPTPAPTTPNPTPPTAGSGCTSPAWMAAQTYVGNEVVSFQGIEYTAAFWTKGNEPAASWAANVYGPWRGPVDC